MLTWFFRALYQFLLLLAWPWVWLRLWWRGRREPEYRRRVLERFGRLDDSIPVGALWFHTVSAGETIAAAPWINELMAQFQAQSQAQTKKQPFLVTTMTPTGSAQVLQRLPKVAHCYAPYDFPWVVGRFLQRVQPRALVLMETELWPNLIAAAHRRGIPVLLVNARLSDRSAAGYARVRPLVQRMLGQLRVIACQESDHAQRFIALGAQREQVQVLGNVKYDKTLPSDHGEWVAARGSAWCLTKRWVWLAASTHPGEDAPMLQAQRLLMDRSLLNQPALVIVPRHPVRAENVCELARDEGLNVVRASEFPDGLSGVEFDVIVADTMGELQNLYGLARAAVIGGSLVKLGGHDPVEAALCALPIAMGDQRFNFADVCAQFEAAGVLARVTDAASIAAWLTQWCTDESARQETGASARAVVIANRGASGRLLALLRAELLPLLQRG